MNKIQKAWLLRNIDFIVFWIIVFTLLVTSRIYIYNRLGSRYFWEDVILRFILLLLLLGCIGYAFEKLYSIKKYFVFGICCVTGLGICVLIKSLHEYHMYENIYRGSPGNSLLIHVVNNAPVFTLYIALALAFKLRRERLAQINEVKELKIVSLDNELNYLRAQINPHFLFNTLNSIFSLIDFKNEEARDSVTKFSSLLRYHLYESSVEFIDIENEIAYLKDYMDLQKLRKETHTTVALTVSESATNFKIAPMLLLPFIENSFKFVNHNDAANNAIIVSVDKKDAEMIFSCVNSKEDFRKKEADSGIGISNVKRRLELLYPNRHILEIQDHSTSFNITLKLTVS
jgi:two-component system, LytTR family, sensor kinase